MKYQKQIEEDLLKRLRTTLSELSDKDNWRRRPWFNKDRFPVGINIDDGLIPTEEVAIKIIFPIHSYEILEMNESQLQDMLFDFSNQLTEKVLDSFPAFGKMGFVEVDIKIKMSYRITRLYYKYLISIS